MTEWCETHRTVVFPWHCDHIGHMNVRWYCHFFDDAGFHLWAMKAVPQSSLHARGQSMVVAGNKIDFVHEMTVGDLVVVKSGFIKVGRRSVTSLSRMYQAESGTLCATLESVEVFFDPVARKSAPMPDDIRQILEGALVSLDDD
jgi:acyl-CoA thioester hydrolase